MVFFFGDVNYYYFSSFQYRNANNMFKIEKGVGCNLLAFLFPYFASIFFFLWNVAEFGVG